MIEESVTITAPMFRKHLQAFEADKAQLKAATADLIRQVHTATSCGFEVTDDGNMHWAISSKLVRDLRKGATILEYLTDEAQKQEDYRAKNERDCQVSAVLLAQQALANQAEGEG